MRNENVIVGGIVFLLAVAFHIAIFTLMGWAVSTLINSIWDVDISVIQATIGLYVINFIANLFKS